MDANENIYTKGIGQMLTDREGLVMKEVVGDFTGKILELPSSEELHR